MLKRFLSAFFALVTALLGHAPAAQKQTAPVFTGSFLQAWYCVDWDESRWDAEIDAMKEAGLDKLILQDTAQMDLRGGWTVYYPTELDALRGHGGYGDVIEGALRACRKGGLRLFVGLAGFESWWVLGGLLGQYDKVCAVMADMQREIFARYHERYPDAFYGWYFTPEISNVPTMKASVPSLARGLNRVLDTATALDPAMPVLLSPYFTEYLAVPSVLATLPLWQTLLETAHSRDGDIFCPQDAVGAQWTPQRDLEKVWQMYREAVAGCGKELCLWANCETLTVARKAIPLMPPATVETVNSAATLDRLVWQMRIAAKYCDEIVTFSYNHYYSPLTGTSVYHDCYLDYLKNGCTLEREEPTAPENVRTEDGVLRWEAASDNVGVAYYLVMKNGKAVGRVEAGADLAFAVKRGSYAVTAVDAAGNRSAAVPA